MGFIQKCFIRTNEEYILKRLENMGYEICPCCYFENAVWLSTLPENGTVHGVGYTDELRPLPIDNELDIFLQQKGKDMIDCGTDSDLFCALAKLREETDIGRWFWYQDRLMECTHVHRDIITKNSYFIVLRKDSITEFEVQRSFLIKATVEEIINHFKQYNNESKV